MGDVDSEAPVSKEISGSASGSWAAQTLLGSSFLGEEPTEDQTLLDSCFALGEPTASQTFVLSEAKALAGSRVSATTSAEEITLFMETDHTSSIHKLPIL